ncbi:MAG: hypothetical protein IJE05_01280 [Clostridia bacterium]|nr:hypothetical protein [Clostridia bacterium]
MKVFENKSIWKKIIIILLCIFLLSFCMPKSVDATDDNNDGIGGKLLSPIMSLLVGIGDGALTLLEKLVIQNETPLINIDSSASFWAKFWVGLASVAVLAGAIVSVVLTGGTTIVVALNVAKVIITIGGVAIVTFPVTTSIVENMLPDSFYLPLYSITPQEIFTNKVPLLDVDFFTEGDPKYITSTNYKTEEVNSVKKELAELKEKHGYTGKKTKTEDPDGDYPTDVYIWDYNGYRYQMYVVSRI